MAYLCPIEGKERHTKPMDDSEELVDHDVVRNNPANEGEEGQSAEQVIGDDVPDGRRREDNEEKLLAPYAASSTYTSVGLRV